MEQENKTKCTLCGKTVEDLKYAICNSCLEEQRNPKIPGTIINKEFPREYRYIADDGNDFWVPRSKYSKNWEKSLFHKITQGDPPIAQDGGVVSEGCKLRLPTNELFHALSYKGDIEGWRKQIELNAEQLGLLTGKIVRDNIELSDGRVFALSACKIDS